MKYSPKYFCRPNTTLTWWNAQGEQLRGAREEVHTLKYEFTCACTLKNIDRRVFLFGLFVLHRFCKKKHQKQVIFP